MRRFLLLTVAAVLSSGLSGCLSASIPQINCWILDFDPSVSVKVAQPSFGTVRLAQVGVRAPYGAKAMAVLRANGTVAFDAYNEYAALPATLIKGVARDVLKSSGRFREVVGSTSSVKTDLSAEIGVSRLALDCRKEGSRMATAAVELRLVRMGEPVCAVTGEAKIDAADGAYGAAFSRAISAALVEALGKLEK